MGAPVRHVAARALNADPADISPLAFLSAGSIAQAGSFSLFVSGKYADAGTATFNKLRFPLFADSGNLVAVFGAGQLVADQVEIERGSYPVPGDTRRRGAAPLSFGLTLGVTPTDFPVDYIDLPPNLSALLDPATAEGELSKLKSSYGTYGLRRLWQGLFQWPVVGPITTNFGQARSYNGGPVSGHHSGVDIGADAGTPVLTAAAGIVAFTGPLPERGNMIIVDHGWGVFTGYAHLSAIAVQVADSVAQGDFIGRVGTTGLSTGPHLHWECAVNGVNVDASFWTTTLLP
jgi:murein DD-endopeptidase MepM/ murein hydrolase activator NlpD